MSTMLKKSIYLVFLIVTSTIYCQTTLTAKVIGIKDGDTVVVLDSINNQTTLRLAEVDCPEKKSTIRHKSKAIHIRPNLS